MLLVSEQLSLASQTIAGATASTGVVRLPSASGVRDPAAGCILVYPTGEKVFTRIPCSAPSSARMRINPTTAHLAAAYVAWPRIPNRPTTDVVRMIFPER